MRVAVFSDIHENYHNFRIAFKEMLQNKIEEAIFLGDYINPGFTKEIFAAFKKENIKLHAIFGNNDGDRGRIMSFAIENNVDHATGEFMELEVDSKKVFITHYSDIGMNIDRTKFNAIFFGHDHTLYIDESKDGLALAANPGELSSHLTGRSTFLIWDTKLNSVEVIKLKEDELYNPNL